MKIQRKKDPVTPHISEKQHFSDSRIHVIIVPWDATIVVGGCPSAEGLRPSDDIETRQGIR